MKIEIYATFKEESYENCNRWDELECMIDDYEKCIDSIEYAVDLINNEDIEIERRLKVVANIIKLMDRKMANNKYIHNGRYIGGIGIDAGDDYEDERYFDWSHKILIDFETDLRDDELMEILNKYVNEDQRSWPESLTLYYDWDDEEDEYCGSEYGYGGRIPKLLLD